MTRYTMIVIIVVFILIYYDQSVDTKLLVKNETHPSVETIDIEKLDANLVFSIEDAYISYINKTTLNNGSIIMDYDEFKNSTVEDTSDNELQESLKGNTSMAKPLSTKKGIFTKHLARGGYNALEVSHKSPEELIKLRGFKVETHHARTKDGYHVHLVRIINPKLEADKRPVLFNHGLFESATVWLMNSRGVKPSSYKQREDRKLPEVIDMDPKTSKVNCPFLLANCGYDVWLMSMRGTEFSLKHDEYNHKTDSKFWRYSLDHFALMDIPSAVNYIRDKTGANSIGYIGHSQATYTIFALLSSKPNYSDIIKPVIAVAPVSHFKHMTSIARFGMRAIEKLTRDEKNGPFPRHASALRRKYQILCGDNDIPSLPCRIVDSLIGGTGEKWLSGYYSHLPYSSSLMVLRHFGQMLRSGRFSRYDYDHKNMKFYNSTTPPEYPIAKIKSEWILLIGGSTDLLSTPADLKVIENGLKVKPKKSILVDGFNHFDLITSKHAGEKVFEPILDLLERAEEHDKETNEAEDTDDKRR